MEPGAWKWELPRRWFRHAPVPERSLDLRPGSLQTEQMQLHATRQQLRRTSFEGYLMTDRHEVVELAARHSKPALFAAFGGINLKKTREALGLGPGFRTAFLASSCSPMHLLRGEGETGVCPFCGDPGGFHDHMLWRCPNNPLPAGVSVPAPLTRRLGWVSNDGWGASVHIAETVSKVWRHRHGEARL